MAIEIQAALHSGDNAAQELIAGWGVWEATAVGFDPPPGSLQHWTVMHCVDIERASRTARVLIDQGDYSGAAVELARQNAVQGYVNGAMLEALGTASTAAASLGPRVAAMLEFLLSQVALVDVQLHARHDVEHSPFGDLLEADSSKPVRPGRGFLKWLQRRHHSATLLKLQDRAAAGCPREANVVDEASLKRWSNGSAFPTMGKARALVRALTAVGMNDARQSAELDAAWHQFWAARRLNELLRFVDVLTQHEDKHGRRRCVLGLMGADTGDDWCRRRYPFWLSYWRHEDRAEYRASSNPAPLA